MTHDPLTHCQLCGPYARRQQRAIFQLNVRQACFSLLSSGHVELSPRTVTDSDTLGTYIF